MLILTRKDGEKVTISKDGVEICTIKVAEIRTSMVVLGFVADKSVQIMRDDAKQRKETA